MHLRSLSLALDPLEKCYAGLLPYASEIPSLARDERGTGLLCVAITPQPF
jgi:hypothetical protein